MEGGGSWEEKTDLFKHSNPFSETNARRITIKSILFNYYLLHVFRILSTKAGAIHTVNVFLNTKINTQ